MTSDARRRALLTAVFLPVIAAILPSQGRCGGSPTAATSAKTGTRSTSSGITRLNVAQPKTADGGNAVWKPSLELGPESVFHSGDDRTTPLKEHEFPSGAVGIRTAIDTAKPKTYVELSDLPGASLARIKRYLATGDECDLVERPVSTYKGKYSLLDAQGNTTERIEVGWDGAPVVMHGFFYWVAPPGEKPVFLFSVPGLRVTVHPGVRMGEVTVAGGDLVYDLVLKPVHCAQPGGAPQTVADVLIPQLVKAGPAVFRLD